MPRLSLPAAALRFPARCVECGAPPARSFALALPRGAAPAAVQAPLCERCGERKSLGQAAWVGGALAAGVALMVALAALIDAALVPALPGIRRVVAPIVVALLGLAAVPVWAASRRGRRSYHRRFSAVWVEGPGPAGEVTLGLRRDDLCREVALASGLGGAGGPFRAPAAPPAFTPGKNPVPAWAVVLFGILVLPAGVAEYVSLGKAEARGETIRRIWLEVLVYDVGGRAAVLALFAVFGVACIAAGALLWRQATQPRPDR